MKKKWIEKIYFDVKREQFITQKILDDIIAVSREHKLYKVLETIQKNFTPYCHYY